jgi:hypothetical protein
MYTSCDQKYHGLSIHCRSLLLPTFPNVHATHKHSCSSKHHMQSVSTCLSVFVLCALPLWPSLPTWLGNKHDQYPCTPNA